MQLLSLSCVICISGEPRRYTQRERERETTESDVEREERLRNRRGKGGKHTVMGEPI